MRKVLFWLHLIVGIVGGIVIALLCATGVILSFEHEIEGWAQGDSLKVDAEAERLPIDEIVAAVRAADPDWSPSQIVAHEDRSEAWTIQAGRRDRRYVDPTTGALIEHEAGATEAFFHWNFRLHRWLLQGGDARPIGKAITGVANLLFLLLAVTGLILWFPKKLRWKQFRNVLLFRRGLRPKARDFNWHNVFGFWSLIPVVILIVTGAFFSYDWARDATKAVLGENPARQALEVPEGIQISSRGHTISLQKRLEIAQEWAPDWRTITLQIGTGGRRGNGGRQQGNANLVTVHEHRWLFANNPSRVRLDLRSGALLAEDRVQSWTLREELAGSIKALHTGEVAGLFGKTVAALASLAGLVLVYTGFALSWRRFFPSSRGRSRRTETGATTA